MIKCFKYFGICGVKENDVAEVAICFADAIAPGDSIVGLTWQYTDGLGFQAPLGIDGLAAKALVSGGIAGHSYVVKAIVSTAAGLVIPRAALVAVSS